MNLRYWLGGVLSALALVAAADEAPPEAWRFSLALTPAYLGGADIEGGGRYESRIVTLSLGTTRPVSAHATAGVGLSLARYDNRFDGDDAFAATPWGDVERIGLSLPVFARSATGWACLVTPSLDYVGERGAERGDALIYGAVASVARLYGPDRSIGVGAGVFSQIEETRAFPFVAVDWRFNETLRLSNPLPAGPTGPAGLELNYRASAHWELGIGAAWRSVRFRLSETGPFPSGVGEERGIVAFLHAATRVSKGVSLDLYGGTLLNGTLAVEDSRGDRIARHGLDTAPLLGATLRARF